MNRPSIKICEHEGTVELSAFGELTSNNANIFRLHLVKLLQHGKFKSYKLNLKNVTTVDASCMELIYILKRELSAVHSSLVVDMAEQPEVKTLPVKSEFLQMLS